VPRNTVGNLYDGEDREVDGGRKGASATESNAIAHNSLTAAEQRQRSDNLEAPRATVRSQRGRGGEEWMTGKGKASVPSVGNRNLRGGHQSI